MINQQKVKSLFDYDKDTGILSWKSDICQNGVTAGREAGSIDLNGYRNVTIDRKVYYVHRIIWLYVYGYYPENSLDHINRKPGDNRINNLREISGSCNLRNSKVFSTNKTGIKGICFDSKNSKWRVQMTVNYVALNLGRYTDFTEAVCVRLATEQCLDWNSCDANSSAYQYVKKYLLSIKN
jgi:hypothetical protein